MTDANMIREGRGAQATGAMNTQHYEPEQRVTATSGGGGAPAAAESYQTTAFEDKDFNPAGSNAEHGAQIQIGDPMTEGPFPDDLTQVDVSLQQTFTQLTEIRSALRSGVSGNSKEAVQKDLLNYVQQLQAINENTFKMLFVVGGTDRMPAGEKMLRTLYEQNKALLSQHYNTQLKSNPDLAGKPQNPKQLDGEQLQNKIEEPNDMTTGAVSGTTNNTGSAYGLADDNYKGQ